ncbi:NmrA family NAD(P)-binding protein [Lentzea sp. BCCO 10_0061]|uniref:NmrA family NAD(P)-binding protein n=1 Tax=Lentzea sokolovensis TaxID=3095429 RepID=A0ABU4UQY0_9PSEU|nr:NmrA family NAD(P)-binding protein [Lentzea sp. BCCO 10_0061]MDX8141892.1 NmrA family NAD(P)-binding protein [Lentzea sp. BCCO 10_0061]
MSAPVLVTGATGKQGGAAVHALKAAGVPVRALVRDPSADRATALGVELVAGDLNDRDSLVSAAKGARAVFSVQMAALTEKGFDFAGELAQATNLLEAAAQAGVPQFIQTTVDGAGDRITDERFPIREASLNTKAEIQDRVRAAGFERWTLLKPGFFMENFLPSSAFLFPRGVEGGLVSLLKPDTRLSLVAVQDVGTAVAAAVAEPERFDRVELELTSEHLSMAEIAAVLSDALGVPLSAPDMTLEEAFAAGMPEMGAGHDRLNETGMVGRPSYATALGLPLTSFAQWAAETVS